MWYSSNNVTTTRQTGTLTKTYLENNSSMFEKALKLLSARRDLDEDIMSACMHAIMSGEATDVQISSFLTALMMKGETAQEIAAAARVMRSKAATIPLKHSLDDALVDIVGTGGDMANTFNISTAAAFVACAAGLSIAKHGNRAATSSCGSADVLEALGVNIMLTPAQVAACIERIGIGFLFARNLHPAMKYAAPVRAQISVPTVFNLLGPLTNPADADYVVLGVNRHATSPPCWLPCPDCSAVNAPWLSMAWTDSMRSAYVHRPVSADMKTVQ